ncbi:MAG: type III-B CRISPR-associated protein Cas10/Cmr2 [Thermoplasmata archaeon]|nr:type III-B CRISPR-associated protein Cas10/Cmr2 [Thermoplasmata archaeon]
MLIDERIWDRQISNAVEITSAWVGFLGSNKFENLKDDIPDDLRKKQEELLSFVEKAGGLPIYGYFYYLTYELLGAILSQKSRFWNAWEEELITGKKCLMCGRRNALIERFRDRNSDKEYYRYWQGNKWEKKSFEEVGEFRYLLRERERLCAVCLTKRLYGWRRKSVFKEIFGVESPKQESVVHVAARDFIEKTATHPVLKEIVKRDAELIYEHEWGESEERIPEEKREAIEDLKKKLGKGWKELKDEIRKIYEQLCEKPNKYYAILMMDGDRIGKMLSGENLVNLGEFLHPVFKKKILEWEKGKDLVSAKRILTPSHHIAISRAMKDFSLYKVPEIIKEYKGFLVYAGGDDVLALLPTNRVLNAAYEIQKAFKEDFYEIEINGRRKEVMGLGKRASMSAGIIFAHYKWALYDAVEKVREAEKRAKNKYGRNAFCMTFIKHSGEILVAGGKWDFVTNLIDIAEVVTDGKISHRFIYDFMDVAEILEGDMLKAETKRLLRRRKAEKMSDDEIEKLQEKLLHLIEKYWSQDFSIKELGIALKILYDAYRGEEG